MALLDSLIKMRSSQTASGNDEPGFLKTLLLATAPGQAYTRVKQDQERRSALKDLASSLGPVPMDGSYGPQRPLDRQSALLKYGAITGDLAPLGIGSDDTAPAAVREYQYLSSLPQQDQQKYLALKRQSQIVDLGGEYATRNPLTGALEALGFKTLPPINQPQNVYNQAQASTQGQKDVQFQMDPSIAAAETDARLRAENAVKRELQYPEDAATVDESIDVVNKALTAPGFDANFGKMGMFPNLPGGDAADAATYIEQIRGASFLSAIQKLRGTGQITEKEGDAATAAVGRFQKAQSAKSAREALADYKRILINAKARAAKGTKYEGAKGSGPVLPKAFDGLDSGVSEETNFEEYFR